MIDFIKGILNVGGKNILAASDVELNLLANGGLLQKCKDAVGDFYCARTEAEGMKFDVTIDLREKKIRSLRLHWSDSPMKGWNDVSVKGVKEEYHLLLKFVEKCVGRPPDNKKNREHTWLLNWGRTDVSFDLRSFQADIYMVPR